MRTDKVPESTSGNESTMPPRRPFWAVGLIFLVLVLALLGAAFFLNARLRPPVGVETSTLPTSESTALSSPSRQYSPNPESTNHPALSATPSTTGGLITKQAVTNAYLRYWDVYDQALYNLDTSHLNEVMADNELTRVEKQIAALQAQNHAVKSDVTHDLIVADLNQSEAGVQDHFLDKSVLIDAKTKQPLETAGTGQSETIACQLKIIDGTWKVVNVVRIHQ